MNLKPSVKMPSLTKSLSLSSTFELHLESTRNDTTHIPPTQIDIIALDPSVASLVMSSMSIPTVGRMVRWRRDWKGDQAEAETNMNDCGVEIEIHQAEQIEREKSQDGDDSESESDRKYARSINISELDSDTVKFVVRNHIGSSLTEGALLAVDRWEWQYPTLVRIDVDDVTKAEFADLDWDCVKQSADFKAEVTGRVIRLQNNKMTIQVRTNREEGHEKDGQHSQPRRCSGSAIIQAGIFLSCHW